MPVRRVLSSPFAESYPSPWLCTLTLSHSLTKEDRRRTPWGSSILGEKREHPIWDSCARRRGASDRWLRLLVLLPQPPGKAKISAIPLHPQIFSERIFHIPMRHGLYRVFFLLRDKMHPFLAFATFLLSRCAFRPPPPPHLIPLFS